MFVVLIYTLDVSTVVPATAISASKEAIAPSQIHRHVSEVNVRLLREAATDADNDVRSVSPATGWQTNDDRMYSCRI